MFYCIAKKKHTNTYNYFDFKTEHEARSFTQGVAIYLKTYKVYFSRKIKSNMKPFEESTKKAIIIELDHDLEL